MATAGGNYQVAAPELRAHAGIVEQVAGQVGAAGSAATAVRLGAAAYGQLCQVIPALIAPVQDGGAQALDEAATSLRTMAESVRAAAAGYQRADDVAATGYQRVSPS